MKVKLASVFIIIAIVAALGLTGCSEKEKAASTTTPSAESAAAATAAPTQAATEAPTVAPKDPVTINYTSFRSDDEAIMKTLIEKFQKENPTITVKYDPQKDAGIYYQTLKANILSDENVDVFDIHPNVDFLSFIKEGYIEDLSPLEFNKVYAKSALEITGSDGKNYGYLNGSNMILLFYNKQVLQDAGVAVPIDFNSLTDAVNKLKEKKYGGIAYAGGDVAGNWLANALLNEEAGPAGYAKFITDIDTGAGTSLKDNPAVYSALKTLGAINKAKLLYDNSVTVKYPQSLALFADKKAPFMMMGTWTFGTADTDFPGIDYGIIAFPTLTKSDVAYGEPAQITSVFKNSKHLQEAKLFVDFLAKVENASIYNGAAKMTPTLEGIKSDFKGAELLSAQLSKGINVLPIVAQNHADISGPILNQLYSNILFKGADVDKEIASVDAAIKKANFKDMK